jgi:hypothetical protein
MDFRRLGPQAFECCKELLRTHEMTIVHVDTKLNPHLMLAARELRIPIVYYIRVAVHGELHELAPFADHIVTA